MNSLTDLTVSPAVVGDCDLHGLRAAVGRSPNFVPRLLAWLEHAVGWEIDRRAGVDYPLLGPHAAIDDTEIERSLNALAVLAAFFPADERIGRVPLAHFIALTVAVVLAEDERRATSQ